MTVFCSHSSFPSGDESFRQSMLLLRNALIHLREGPPKAWLRERLELYLNQNDQEAAKDLDQFLRELQRLADRKAASGSASGRPNSAKPMTV